MTSAGRLNRTTSRERSLFVALVLFGLLFGATTSGVDAHKASRFYTLFGHIPDSRYHIPYYFDSAFPQGRKRTRVMAGAKAWNKLGRKVVFVGHRPSVPTTPSNCQNINGERAGAVRWESIDGPRGYAGLTQSCVDSVAISPGNFDYWITGFVMTFDSGQGWYDRTGEPGGDQTDLWGVATHEFGHATGWGLRHFTGQDDCGGNGIQTMCGYREGSSLQRTLGGHDIHTMKAHIGAR